MGILKYGVIALFIMIPFIVISYESIEADTQKQRVIYQLEHNLEEASYDAAFAMKTYSMAYYDSDAVYKIETDYTQVCQAFFDSLGFRGFRFEKEDFPFLAFISYDGIVFYTPKNNIFYPKLYYTIRSKNGSDYVNLDGKCLQVNHLSGKVSETIISKEETDKVVLSTLEKGLNQLSELTGMDDYEFVLPEVKGGLYMTDVTDLGFLSFYSSSTYYGLGRVHYFSVKPSGIMKIKDY